MKIMESSDFPPAIELPALTQMLGGDMSLVKMILEKFRAEIAVDIAALPDLATSGGPEPIRALISSPSQRHLQ